MKKMIAKTRKSNNTKRSELEAEKTKNYPSVKINR